MSATRSILVRISGRVQGVGYRDWTQREATARALSGWVRNLPTGEVEAVFSGDAVAVDAMLVTCRSGPRFAQVAQVTVVGEAEPQAGGFVIRR
ncbi:MAG: acylphosphatase [Xanthobacteraceae bacterium]